MKIKPKPVGELPHGVSIEDFPMKSSIIRRSTNLDKYPFKSGIMEKALPEHDIIKSGRRVAPDGKIWNIADMICDILEGKEPTPVGELPPGVSIDDYPPQDDLLIDSDGKIYSKVDVYLNGEAAVPLGELPPGVNLDFYPKEG